MKSINRRILRLIDLLIFHRAVKNYADFCRKIKMHPTTLNNIKNQKQSFTVELISTIIRRFDINANWLFGSETQVFNSIDNIHIEEDDDDALPAMLSDKEN